MKRNEGGFTLIEVLISVALLGMLTALAYGAVRFAALSWRRTTDFRSAESERMAIIQVLRTSLTAAYPAYASATLSNLKIAFDGGPGSLDLIAPLPEAIEAGVMARERYDTVENAAGARSLVMTWSPDLPAAGGGSIEPRIVRLAGSIGTFTLTYFGAPKQGQPPAWYDQWFDMEALPELVRVRVWRQGATGAPWIDFTAQPSTTTNTDCVYDPVDSFCRRRE